MNDTFKTHVHHKLLRFALEIGRISEALEQGAISRDEATERKLQLAAEYAEGISGQLAPPEEEAPEAVALLLDVGIDTQTARQLAASCSLDDIRGWVTHAQCSIGLRNPAGLVVSRLRKQVPAPKLPEAADGASRYLSGEYAAFIQH